MKTFRKYANPPANGHQMLQQLSHAGPGVKERFLSNLKASRGDRAAETYLNERFENAKQFLASAFVWKSAPEGPMYWLRVSVNSHAAMPWNEWWDTYAQK